MKILVLENEPTSRSGGKEWSLLDVCRGLAQRGHELDFVYIKNGDLLESYQEFCQSLVKVNCYLTDNKSQRQKLTSTIAWISSILGVLKTSPDVIYVTNYSNTFFGGTLAQLKGVPMVCHLRSLPPRGRTFRGQIRLGLKSVTRFITVSEATRTSYLRAGFPQQSIEVVYNGIDLTRFDLKDDREQTRFAQGIPKDAFVVIYAGRIDHAKNIEMLIEAFAQLGLTAERARLLIVGSPIGHATPAAGESYVQELKCLCDSLGISSSVHWLGRRADIPELFRAADVSVLPSLLPDTFGRVLAESMACGTPALGLRFGGIPEVLSGEFERFRVEVGDVSGLANSLRSLNGWQHHDPTLGQRCRAYVEERFPASRMVEGVERVLSQAVALGAVRLGPSAASLQLWRPDALGI